MCVLLFIFIFLKFELMEFTVPSSEVGICWVTIPTQKVRDRLETVPKTETYTDWNCMYPHNYPYYRPSHECQKTRTVNSYHYVTENYVENDKVRVCCTGYRENNNYCEPICEEECINATCTQPNTCECKSGYIFVNGSNSSESYICEPICDPECVNGVCSSPNNCVCQDGYNRSSYLHTSEHVCTPFCSPRCKNGICMAPNECTCYNGYEKESDTECKPICEHDCLGVCTAPNFCTCSDNYLQVNNTHCHPKCDPPCKNGVCFSPGQCICLEGYKEISNTECEPICDEDCPGVCTEPNVCTCSPSYIQVNDTYCQPKCDPPCTNSICTVPNTCSCFENYEKINNYTCRPLCDSPCPNGECVEVNTCECNIGYSKQDGNDTFCAPVCSFHCINGICVLPEQCQCLKDYIYSNETLCLPYCENGCQHGTCVEPYQCKCNSEYLYNNETNKCEIVCEDFCLNGTCIKNKCYCTEGNFNENCIIQCKDNYTLNNNTKYCEPDCYNCQNGYCIEPNQCICPYNHYYANNNICKIKETYKEMYATLYNTYITKSLFLSCKYDLYNNKKKSDLKIYLVFENYNIFNCDNHLDVNFQCEVTILNMTSQFVNIECNIYKNSSNYNNRSQKYGKIVCLATSRTNDELSSIRSSQGDIDDTSTIIPTTDTITSYNTVSQDDDMLTKNYPGLNTVFYHCDHLEVNRSFIEEISSLSNGDSISSYVFIGYFVDKRYQNISIQKCSTLCPSLELRTNISLIDGSQFEAPIEPCFKDDRINSETETTVFYFLLALILVVVVVVIYKLFKSCGRKSFEPFKGSSPTRSAETYKLGASFTEINLI